MQSQATSKVQKRDKQGQMVVLGVVVYAHVNQHIIMVSTNTSSLLPSATFGVGTFKGRLTKKHDLHVGVYLEGTRMNATLQGGLPYVKHQRFHFSCDTWQIRITQEK
jgi:hypothetical protein